MNPGLKGFIRHKDEILEEVFEKRELRTDHEALDIALLIGHCEKLYHVLKMAGFDVMWTVEDENSKMVSENHKLLQSLIIQLYYYVHFKQCLDSNSYTLYSEIISDLMLRFCIMPFCPLMTKMKGPGVQVLIALWHM